MFNMFNRDPTSLKTRSKPAPNSEKTNSQLLQRAVLGGSRDYRRVSYQELYTEDPANIGQLVVLD